MKKTILISLITYHLSLITLSSSAAVPLKWTVETSRAQPATFEAYQGETLTFEAALQSAGKPLEMSGIAALYWQTNGMGSAWWETTAAVNSNRLSAVWTPEMDVGSKVYNCFIGIPGTVYHAAFQLRLRPSPGATPNALPLPTPVIDFARVRVLNPPWGSGGGGVDTNAVEVIANKAVETNAVTVGLSSSVSGLQSAVSGLQSSKLDKSDVIDPESASATTPGKAADALKVKTMLDAKANNNNPIFSSSINLDDPTGVLKIYSDNIYFSSGVKNNYLYFPDHDSSDTSIFAFSSFDILATRAWTDYHYLKKESISESNPIFSNAVLAVGLNIDTNSVAVLNEIAKTFGDFPIEGTATTVGGLLAALAAVVAWLKKNKVGSFESVGGASATVDNGVAKLDDFFTNSNSLLTGTIDDRLPIPISEKSDGFTTESYKRFVVTVSGDMTMTLHTPTSGDAEIFECRFDGTSLAADASITFVGATATTMDANCGTVTAGKVSLMSAFWNGSTWDVNWKVEG